MDKQQVIELVKNGIANANHTKIVNAYHFITGKQLSGSCGECARRRAIQAIIKYVKIN